MFLENIGRTIGDIFGFNRKKREEQAPRPVQRPVQQRPQPAGFNSGVSAFRAPAAQPVRRSVVGQPVSQGPDIAGGFAGTVNTITGGATNTLGNAIASGVDYTRRSLDGSIARENREAAENRIKAMKLQRQANSTMLLDPAQKQKLLREAQSATNMANTVSGLRRQEDQRLLSDTDPVKVGASILGAGLTAVAPGAGKVASTVASRVAPVVPRAVATATGAAASGALGGTGYGALGQLQQTGLKTDAGDLAKSAAIGAGAGAVVGGAGSAAMTGAKAVVKRAQEIQAQPGFNSQAGFAKVPVGNDKPVVTLKNKQSRFASRVPTSEEVSPDLQSQVKQSLPTYTPVTNAGQLERSKVLLKKGVGKSYVDVNKRLDVKNVDDQTVSDSIAVIKSLDEKGGEANLQKATDLVEKLSLQLTRSGQTVQAASLLSNRTPQGLYYGAVKSLKKAGVPVDANTQAELKTLIERVKKVDAGSEGGAQARYDIAKYVNDKIPTGLAEKVTGLWRAGLLTAPTTTGGNLLGNTGETVVRKGFVDPVAAGADALMGLVTGKRTKTLSGGFAEGAKEGSGKLGKFLKTGYDERNALSKYDTREINYGNGKIGKALTRYTNGVYRLMSVADQPYWYGTRKESLRSLAKAEALNAKIPREQRGSFIEDFVNNPPKKALERATQEAMYATFQNKTGLGEAALGFKRGLNKIAPGLGDFIVPFTQVPASIATRIFQRTPVGTATELVKQLVKVHKGGQFDQRAMAQSIGEGAFGTAVLASGYALANSGMLTFGYPEDQKERELWEAEGKQPYSIRIGDRWYSLNYIQPFGTLLAIGGQAASDVKDGENLATATSNAVATAGQSVMNQSFLKGVSGVLDAIDDPKRYAENFIENTASSIVPNAVRSLARSGDPMQRDVNGVTEGLQSAIPGLRQSLPEKQDMFGNGLPAKDDFLNQFLNPLRPSKVKDDPTVAELRRLYEGDQAILPTQSRVDTFEGEKLTKEQIREINSLTGPEMKKGYESVINDPRYASLSDDQKRATLKKVNDTVFGALKQAYGYEKGIIPEDKVKLSANQQRFLRGEAIDYLASKAKAGKVVKPAKVGAKKKGTGGGGRGGGGGGKKSLGKSNYAYAVSLKAGGEFKKPTVQARKVTPIKIASASTAKPKVSIKKSNV